jgi:TetR/AcrR family transcriptional regulator
LKELFRKIPEEKRNCVIQAAVDEFAEHGYESANTNKIAKDAHISVGSLFQYFENKEDLFLSVVQYGSQLLIDAFREVVLESDPFFVTVEKILRRIIRESREHPNYVKLYFEMTAPSKVTIERQVVSEMEEYSHQLYCRVILKGKEEGIIRSDCDLRVFPFLLDNLFVMLQYSFSCGYYQERFKLYGGESVLNEEDTIVEQTMKFMKGAFSV